MAKKARCAFCKKFFEPALRGRRQLYCCASHRQRAFEQRRLVRYLVGMVIHEVTEETVGSIIYDLRLPPDPKLGKDVKGLMPDLSVYELEQLRAMIRQFREWYIANDNYAAILFPMGAHHNANDRRDAFRMHQPLFQKILGEA